jgi:hypothetical protein
MSIEVLRPIKVKATLEPAFREELFTSTSSKHSYSFSIGTLLR